ncbi:MAG: GIY-YIG domain protein [Candidatus Uhrbacteria bacterium GW2011_GWA2_41_10]|nr:MAG: GIY-YIG domain protein [Candidatus Uhrbacteria bacterium GW2011_GWA2_41_10]
MSLIYLLFSPKINRFYIGSSRENTVESRLKRHNEGRVKSTKFGSPWKVVCVEHFETYTQARKRELYLKSGVGRGKIAKVFGYLKGENIWRGTQEAEGAGLLNL